MKNKKPGFVQIGLSILGAALFANASFADKNIVIHMEHCRLAEDTRAIHVFDGLFFADISCLDSEGRVVSFEEPSFSGEEKLKILTQAQQTGKSFKMSIMDQGEEIVRLELEK